MKANDVKIVLPSLVIIILAFILRLELISGLEGGDNFKYAEYAYNIAKGNYEIPQNEWSLRLGMLFPVAIFIKLFGVTEASAVVYPFLCSLSGVFLAYGLGKLIFNQQIGLTSALLYSFFPFAVIGAGYLGTDIPCAFFTALSMFFFFRSDKKKKDTASVDLFLSGLFLGIGYLHKTTALWLLPVFFLLVMKRLSKRNFFFVVGLLTILLLESSAVYLITGNPFTRWKILLSGSHHNYMAQSYTSGGSLSKNHILAFMSALFNPLDKQVLYAGLYFLFAFAAVVYYTLKKGKKIFPLILWWIIPLIIAIFGTFNLSSYVPFVQAQVRHVSIIIFPTVLILACLLSEFKDRKKHFYASLGFGSLIISSILILVFSRVFGAWGNRDYSYNERAIYNFLIKEKKEMPVYTADTATASALKFLYKYENNGRFHYIENNQFEQLDAGLLVINWKRIGYRVRHGGKPAPKVFNHVPPHWDKLVTVRNPARNKYLQSVLYKALTWISGGRYKALVDELFMKAEIYEVGARESGDKI